MSNIIKLSADANVTLTKYNVNKIIILDQNISYAEVAIK
jgi:hypothetical protein